MRERASYPRDALVRRREWGVLALHHLGLEPGRGLRPARRSPKRPSKHVRRKVGFVLNWDLS